MQKVISKKAIRSFVMPTLFESKDLVYGIEWILNAPNYDELCVNSREKVMRKNTW